MTEDKTKTTNKPTTASGELRECPHGTIGTCAICESADWAIQYRLQRKSFRECTHAVADGETCQLCPTAEEINRLREYNDPIASPGA